MNTIQVECFSEESNGVILRTPGRHFPGIVLQGDTLRSLCRKAERALAALDASDVSEAKDYMFELFETLQDKLAQYETVLKDHSMQLPYPDPITNRLP